jgi:hypothetical protein
LAIDPHRFSTRLQITKAELIDLVDGEASDQDGSQQGEVRLPWRVSRGMAASKARA